MEKMDVEGVDAKERYPNSFQSHPSIISHPATTCKLIVFPLTSHFFSFLYINFRLS